MVSFNTFRFRFVLLLHCIFCINGVSLSFHAARADAYAHACALTQTRVTSRTLTRTHERTRIFIRIPSHTHFYAPFTHTLMCTWMHTRTHFRVCSKIACTQNRTHTQSHTRMLIRAYILAKVYKTWNIFSTARITLVKPNSKNSSCKLVTLHWMCYFSTELIIAALVSFNCSCIFLDYRLWQYFYINVFLSHIIVRSGVRFLL